MRYGFGVADSFDIGFEVILDLLCGDGKQCADGGAGSGSADDVKLPAKLVDPFADAGDANAEGYLSWSAGKNVKDSDAVVLDLHHDRFGVAFDSYARRGGSGVTMNVGQRFLHDTKNSELQFFFQAAKVIGDVNLHGNSSAFREKLRVRTEGGDQPGLLQHRRVQKGRDEANLTNRRARKSRGGS